MKVALYARVSTTDRQTTETQMRELRAYVAARGWTPTEFVDEGVSGAKDRRPGLDAMLAAARRRTVDAVLVWKLDRLGRNLKHLVNVLAEFQATGVVFVSINEGIDFSTPAGRLQFHVLAALAEFERGRIQERVKAGLARARAEGVRLGRPRRRIDPKKLAGVANLPLREAARRLGVPRTTLQRAVARKPTKSSR
jgi:DNA invertase Pin-like site-specific DNA recombinase